MDEARLDITDPDVFFDTARTPPEFVSLEAKLAQSLRQCLKDAKDKSLSQRVEHEDMLRWHRHESGFGGRRIFREVLSFFQLSESRMQMSALQAFWALSWKGDELQQMAKFYHDLRITADAAARGG